MDQNEDHQEEMNGGNDAEVKSDDLVELTGWNEEEKEGKDQHDLEDGDDNEENSMLAKNIFHFFYNMNHALKMVIVNPFSDNCNENDVYRHWVKMASNYDIMRKKDGKSEAVFYFNTIAKGDGAYLDMKSNLEDGTVKVFHPSANTKLKLAKFWDTLKNQSSVAKPPVSLDIGEKIFSRHIIIEKVPESVTEDELIERFPEAINVICFPHVKGTKGLRILEFESESAAMKFLREHKDEEISGASVRMTKYGRRANEWEEKKDREPYQTCVLPKDDRIQKCERLFELEKKKDALINREDIFGEEKIVEFQQLQEEHLQLNEQIKSDTDWRRLKKEEIPESEDFMNHYTKYTDSKEWLRSSRAKKAAIAYGIEKEKSGRKRSVSPGGKIDKEDKNTCFNCGGRGHYARACPSEKEGVECYNCGNSGHYARDCGKARRSGGGRRRSRSPSFEAPSSKRRLKSERRDSERDRYSFRDRSPVRRDDRNRRDRDRPMRMGRGPSPTPRVKEGSACYRCGQFGHYARDCPENVDTCHKCGMNGHYARDCPRTDIKLSSGLKPGETCYKCGGSGHFARDCPSGEPGSRTRTDKCFMCKGEGHFARECPNRTASGGSAMDQDWRGDIGMDDMAMRDGLGMRDGSMSMAMPNSHGDGMGASGDIVANVLRMAGGNSARPTEVAAILQNISQSLSSSVARLERVDMDSRMSSRY